MCTVRTDPAAMMEPLPVRGLLASAGKAIARLPAPRYEAAVRRLRAARSPADLTRTLDGLDLGVAGEGRAAVRAAAEGAGWDDARWHLIRAAVHHRTDRLSPSS